MERYPEQLEEIVADDPRYRLDAYLFIFQVLEYSVRQRKEKRHLTGRELLETIRRFAIFQFGPLSLDVLRYWGINRCEDWGEVVFNLVAKGLLSKTEEDRKEDFRGGYDFREAFEKPFELDSGWKGGGSVRKGRGGGEK